MATLGEIFQSMGPGNIQGMPQMAPPVGIPWQQPQPVPVPVPVPITPVASGRGNAGMRPTGPNDVAKPRPMMTTGGYSTPQAIGDVMAGLQNFLESNRARWAEEDRQGYEDARGRENTRTPGVQSARDTPSDFDGFLNSVSPGGRIPGVPARGNAETQSLGEMFFTDVDIPTRGERVPMPERRGAAPSPAAPRQSGGSGQTVTPARAPSGGRTSTFQNAPNTDDSFPQSSPLHDSVTRQFDPTMQRFLLQAGLAMMVPQWGGPVAQIGQALGQGAEAVQRGQEIDTRRATQNKQLDLEQQKVNKIGLGRRKATESSGSKRMKERTPAQQMAANLSPEAAIYFNQRIKDLNNTGDDESITPDVKMSQIMEETKRVDQRSRETRGLARSDEFPEEFLDKVAGTANEAAVLRAVANDPTQKALIQARLEAIKQRKVNTNAGTAN